MKYLVCVLSLIVVIKGACIAQEVETVPIPSPENIVIKLKAEGDYRINDLSKMGVNLSDIRSSHFYRLTGDALKLESVLNPERYYEAYIQKLLVQIDSKRMETEKYLKECIESFGQNHIRCQIAGSRYIGDMQKVFSIDVLDRATNKLMQEPQSVFTISKLDFDNLLSVLSVKISLLLTNTDDEIQEQYLELYYKGELKNSYHLIGRKASFIKNSMNAIYLHDSEYSNVRILKISPEGFNTVAWVTVVSDAMD